jgi:hypothetical protein
LDLALADIVDGIHALELALRGIHAIADTGINPGHWRGLETQAFHLRQRIEKLAADLDHGRGDLTVARIGHDAGRQADMCLLSNRRHA